MNNLNEYNNKYIIHKQFIIFFYEKLISSSNIILKKKLK